MNSMNRLTLEFGRVARRTWSCLPLVAVMVCAGATQAFGQLVFEPIENTLPTGIRFEFSGLDAPGSTIIAHRFDAAGNEIPDTIGVAWTWDYLNTTAGFDQLRLLIPGDSRVPQLLFWKDTAYSDPSELPTPGALATMADMGMPVTEFSYDPTTLSGTITFGTIVGIPCESFQVSDFGQPMGKKKKLGSTLPVKFQLAFDGGEITSQEELDQILIDNGGAPACPTIVIYDVTDEANALNIELPEELGNVGEGGDLGTCFRYSAPNWIFNLKLDSSVFNPTSSYLVEVEIGDCLFQPGNELFQTK